MWISYALISAIKAKKYANELIVLMCVCVCDVCTCMYFQFANNRLILTTFGMNVM